MGHYAYTLRLVEGVAGGEVQHTTVRLTCVCAGADTGSVVRAKARHVVARNMQESKVRLPGGRLLALLGGLPVCTCVLWGMQSSACYGPAWFAGGATL